MVADLVELHIRVPAVDALHLLETQPIQPADHLEHTGHDAGGRKVWLHLFLGDAVTLLAQLFTVVGDIPGLQFSNGMLFCRKGLEFIEFTLGLLLRPRREIVQKMQHLVGRTRHLAHQRTLRKIGETQQLRLLMPQP